MLRSLAISLLLACTACGVHVVEEAANDGAASQSSFLVGTLAGERVVGTYGEWSWETLTLKSDGTGTDWVELYTPTDIPYAEESPVFDTTRVSWTFDGTTLTVGHETFTDLQTAANCHLFAMTNGATGKTTIFTRPDDEEVAGCPTGEPPLNDIEQQLVGTWESADQVIVFSANRIYADDKRFFVDPDGTFSAIDIDGKVVVRSKVSIQNGQLRMCQTGCTTFDRH